MLRFATTFYYGTSRTMWKQSSFSKQQMHARPSRCLISQSNWLCVRVRITEAAFHIVPSPEDPVSMNVIVSLGLLETSVKLKSTNANLILACEVMN